ncbi:MAG: chemotaxis protein CheW [Isosphaeraceae bacterium]|nr:chemotaxis protein CheW [Isosphaeraceae bacterium]
MNPSRPRVAGPIDWNEAHERLDRSLAALQADAALSPERVQAVLDERARALARVPVRPPEVSEVIEVVTFTLAGERLALESRFVRRVLSRWDCTPVPGAPEALVGVTNLHGEVLALFDLGVLLGVARAGPAASAQLLVLGEDRDELGVLADSLGDVRSLRITDLHEPPASFERLSCGALRGVTEDVLIVVDGRALLADERLFIHQVDEPGA